MNNKVTAVKSFKLQSYTLNNKYVFEEYKNENIFKSKRIIKKRKEDLFSHK